MYLRLLLLLCLSTPLSASWISSLASGDHEIYAGPDAFHLYRKRDGGSYQKGELYGGRVGYQRYRPNGFFWRLQTGYATGTITGKSSGGSTLKSDFIERYSEGDVGYSVCMPYLNSLTVTPYAGYAHASMRNQFKQPSPLLVQFRDKVDLASAGLLIRYHQSCRLDLGIDYKVQWTLKGTNRVSNDPVFDDQKISIGEKTHYSLEAPIRLFDCCRRWAVSIAPFYRHRHLGEHEDYPFDFIDTRFHHYGARVSISRVLGR